MKKFWENKKVLVTGAHGFVGTNLINELIKRGINNVLTPNKKECDLTIEEEVKKYFNENKPNIVIHLAGRVGGIGINKAKPAEFFYENIMMDTLVTHYSFINGVEKLVSLAAGCGYPKLLETPYKEEDFWMGFPDENSYGYSLAKKNLIIQSWAYRDQYGFNSSVLLPANLYGKYDNFNLDTSHVVPALIRKILEAKENNEKIVTVWGTGMASREFLYVRDTVKAILDVAEKYNDRDFLNLGTGVETTIKELVEIIAELTNYDGKIVWDSSKSDGQPRRFYDMSRFEKAIGYVPNTSVKEGIKKTIDWYLQKK
jgi:GDP-L-fucose synthase